MSRHEHVQEQHAGERLNRPKYHADVPPVTPQLQRLGVVAWCKDEFPAKDCTGMERLSRERRPDNDATVEAQERKLQKIAGTLHERYHEWRVKDLAFMMGYGEYHFYKFLYGGWKKR